MQFNVIKLLILCYLIIKKYINHSTFTPVKAHTLFLTLGIAFAPCQQTEGQSLTYCSPFEETAFTQVASPAQTTLLALLLSGDPAVNETVMQPIQQCIAHFCDSIRHEKSKSDRKFLQLVFKQVQAKFFGRYEKYAHFRQLFSDSVYNCLSGTALYGLVLQQLGYQFEVHETAFHTYLIVHAGKQYFLMDATDAQNGFAGFTYQIQEREKFYWENEKQQFQPLYNRVITFEELIGLQYYNEAIRAYNRQNFEASHQFLGKAARLYARSERIQSLQRIVGQNLSAEAASVKKSRSLVSGPGKSGATNQ